MFSLPCALARAICCSRRSRPQPRQQRTERRRNAGGYPPAEPRSLLSASMRDFTSANLAIKQVRAFDRTKSDQAFQG